tara:strand:+ start:7820 stop:8158 length:339 start_codon:yes stop_codon:yes gene_type:complete
MKRKRRIEQELNQKEFESDIERELRTQELEKEYEEKLNRDYHPLELAAINLFGNLMIGYILFFIFKWFIGPALGFLSSELIQGIFTIFHVLIWGMAIIGVVIKKSPWNRFLK